MNASPVARTLSLALILAAAGLAAGCATHVKPLPLAPTKAPPPRSSQEAPPAYVPPAVGVQSSILPGSQQDFTVNAGDRVYFDYDQYEVRADARPVLQAQAAWLSRYPAVQVRIEGNADERGTREYNFALGARRADSVKQFLIGQGVAANRISTVSYGKERPIDTGEGETAWAHNRNAHTTLTQGAR